MDELDHPPSVAEIMKVIHQMNSDWAPVTDGILAELYKAVGPETINVFHDILSHIWEQEKMPEDIHDALIVALYKNKGSKANCRNYRDISLLSIARKILAWVILNGFITMSEANLPEAQCRFHTGCSLVDMILSLRQVKEKCIEQNLDLYSVFINLAKVNREAL